MKWNGQIDSLKLSHFKYCVAIGNQIKLIVLGSDFTKLVDQLFAFTFLGLLLALTFVCCRFVWTKYDSLVVSEMDAKYGHMY